MQSGVSSKAASNHSSHHGASPIGNTPTKPTRAASNASKVNTYIGGDPFTEGVVEKSSPAPAVSPQPKHSAKPKLFVKGGRRPSVLPTDTNKTPYANKSKHSPSQATAVRNPNDVITPIKRSGRNPSAPFRPQLRSKPAPLCSDTYRKPLVKPEIPVTRAPSKHVPAATTPRTADVIDIDAASSPPTHRHSLSKSRPHALSPSSTMATPDHRRASLPAHISRPMINPMANALKRHPDNNDVSSLKVPRRNSGLVASQPGNNVGQFTNAARTQRPCGGNPSAECSARSPKRLSRMYMQAAVPLCEPLQKRTPGVEFTLSGGDAVHVDGEKDVVSAGVPASADGVQGCLKRPRASASPDRGVVDIDDYEVPVEADDLMRRKDYAGSAEKAEKAGNAGNAGKVGNVGNAKNVASPARPGSQEATVNLTISPNATPKKKQKREVWMEIKADEQFIRRSFLNCVSNHPHLFPFAFFGLTDSDLRTLMENDIPAEDGFERQLDLNNNRINQLTVYICQRFAAYNLCKLNLSHNKLSSLPDAVSACKRLRILSVSGNGLKKLPETLGSLRQLEVLDLSHNALESLPDELGRLSRLRILCVSYNLILTLPEDMASEGSSMFALDISHNRMLGRLPECARHWTKLDNLEMDNTALKDMLVSKDLEENPAILVKSIAGRSEMDLRHRKERGKFPSPN